MAAPDVVNTWVPSTVSVNVTGPGAPPVEALMPTLTVPCTMAASSGLVNHAVSSPYGELTVTVRGAEALRPAPSVTTTERKFRADSCDFCVALLSEALRHVQSPAVCSP